MKKNIAVIFTGTVATTLAKKIVESLSAYHVTAIFTEKAKYFITEDGWTTFNPICKIVDDVDEWSFTNYQKDDKIPHIELAKENDLLLVIASADFLAKMANGICDDLASSLYRAWHRSNPVIVAPAMNTHMWEHPVTQEHVLKLKSWSVNVVNPVEKTLACGDTGMGALADVKDIVNVVDDSFILQFPLENCNGIPVMDKHPGAYLFQRKHAPHTGVDLYTESDEPIYSMALGKIVSIEDFTGIGDNSPWWNNTRCVLVEHWFGVVCYGEMEESSLIKVGDVVKKCQYLGKVKQVLKEGKERSDIEGHSLSMLHVEFYPKSTKKASRTYELDKDNLLDPTQLLIEANPNMKILKNEK